MSKLLADVAKLNRLVEEEKDFPVPRRTHPLHLVSASANLDGHELLFTFAHEKAPVHVRLSPEYIEHYPSGTVAMLVAGQCHVVPVGVEPTIHHIAQRVADTLRDATDASPFVSPDDDMMGDHSRFESWSVEPTMEYDFSEDVAANAVDGSGNVTASMVGGGATGVAAPCLPQQDPFAGDAGVLAPTVPNPGSPPPAASDNNRALHARLASKLGQMLSGASSAATASKAAGSATAVEPNEPQGTPVAPGMHATLVSDIAAAVGCGATLQDVPSVGRATVTLPLSIARDLGLSKTASAAYGLVLDVPLLVRFTFDRVRYLDAAVEIEVGQVQHFRQHVFPGFCHQLRHVLHEMVRTVAGKVTPPKEPLELLTALGFDEPLAERALKKCDGDVHAASKLLMSSGAVEFGDSGNNDGVQKLVELGFDNLDALAALQKVGGNVDLACDLLLAAPKAHLPRPEVDSEALAAMLSMGISDQQATTALRRANNKVDVAVQMVFEGMVEEASVASVPDDDEESTTAVRTAAVDPVDAKRVPVDPPGLFMKAIAYVAQRAPSMSNYCVLCDRPHVFSGASMMLLTVCTRELCVFRFQKLDVGRHVATSIAMQTGVADLLLCIASAAAQSRRWDLIFNPFPTIPNAAGTGLALNEHQKDIEAARAIFANIPTVGQVADADSAHDLQRKMKERHPLGYAMLEWVVNSCKSHIVKLPDAAQLPFMKTKHQYVLVTSSPENEALFAQLKQKHGSLWAFHGSKPENWHSIMRNGLRNASGTKLQVNGSCHGKGVYLSPAASTSFYYSSISTGTGSTDAAKQHFENEYIDPTTMKMIAICEVIDKDIHKSGDIWVQPHEDYVLTRFFFVFTHKYTHGSSTHLLKDSTAVAALNERLSMF